MNLVAFKGVLAASAGLCAMSISYAISTGRQSVSLKKGRTRLLAYVLGGAAICVGALAFVLLQWELPVYRAEGIIQTAQVHSQGRGYRTVLTLNSALGGDLILNASGRTVFFRPGEHAVLRYQGYSGSIIEAHFLSSTGIEEGVFNGTDFWPPYFFLLVGLYLIWIGFKKNRSDPEASEEASVRNPKPYGPIDKFSLLHLSGRATKGTQVRGSKF